MDMLPWTALIKYQCQAHQHATEVTPLVGMIDPPLGIITTPDIPAVLTKIGTGSVVPDPTHITMDIGVAAIMTPAGATPDHSTDLHIITTHATEAQVHTATTVTHHIIDPHPIVLCKAVRSGGLFFKVSRGNYTAYDHVYCNTQLLIFRFSFLCYT